MTQKQLQKILAPTAQNLDMKVNGSFAYSILSENGLYVLPFIELSRGYRKEIFECRYGFYILCTPDNPPRIDWGLSYGYENWWEIEDFEGNRERFERLVTSFFNENNSVAKIYKHLKSGKIRAEAIPLWKNCYLGFLALATGKRDRTVLKFFDRVNMEPFPDKKCLLKFTYGISLRKSGTAREKKLWKNCARYKSITSKP